MCLFKRKRPSFEEAVGEAIAAIQAEPEEKEVVLPHLLFTETPEYRPCWVNKRKALFHRWVNSARPQLPKGQEPSENSRYYQYRATHALVEYEDGTMATIWPTEIRFVDNDHFAQYWGESRQEETNG